MKIGIAGAGGIGSNVAAHLVRGGARRLKIADFDRVDRSNLNRQYYFADQIGRCKVTALADNLLRIAPDAVVEALDLTLNDENMGTVFGDCDVVVEGLDDARAKKQLLEAMAADRRPVVSACGVAGVQPHHIQVRRMGACTMVGDLNTDARHARCHGPKVGIVAAMMAHIVLEKGGFYDH